MGSGIVPFNGDRSHRMLVHQGLREFGNLLSALEEFYQDEIFSALIGHNPDAGVSDGLDCRLTGHHMARKVGNQLRLNSSAKENIPPIFRPSWASSIVFFCGIGLFPRR